MLACIDQGRRDFSTFNDQFSQSESELATLKNNNADLLKSNTEANLTIAALRGQIEKFDISVLPEKRHISEKLPDPELYNGGKHHTHA